MGPLRAHRGEDRTDTFDQVEIHTRIPQAVDEVIAFLTKHAYQAASLVEVRRRDVYSIPVEAIREVAINALVYASYAERGTPIRISFFDDRIEVESPGGLVSGMTVESMQRVSRLRNPSLVQNYAHHLAPLVDANLLEMTVPDKPRSTAQRYRLTDVRRALLTEAGAPS